MPRFEPLSVESSPGSKVDARLKLRIARLQLDQQERREEREFQLRRELELKKLEVEAETSVKLCQLELQKETAASSSVRSSDTAFDVSRNVLLVPPFRESEVESYLGAFEHLAVALRWPKDVWAILLQCKLTGKAQEACSSLSVEDGLNFEKVKSAILRVYELVPEAYRQRFRNLKKTSSQTHADFAREKVLLFDRWCSSCKADDLKSVRELMLLEEFKNCLPDRIVVYLNEQKVASLQQAAYLADEFALTHKPVFVKREQSIPGAALKTSTDGPVTRTPGPQVAGNLEKLCFFCHKPGHVVADCQSLKRKQQASKQPKGVGLIKTASVVELSSGSGGPDECFKPFIFQACVSLTGRVEDQRPVTVLRDTACSQSLILSSVLPLGAESACDASAVVRGIEMGFVPAPLHTVHIKCELITGFFPVAARDSFPVDGVDLIMGNDVAGGKVFPLPEVVVSPIPPSEPDDLTKGHPGVFAANVLTRAQSGKLAKDVDLCDSLFASALTEDRLPPVGEMLDCAPQEPKTKVPASADPLPLTHKALSSAQKGDPSLATCFAAVMHNPGEGGGRQSFFIDKGVLMRKWVSQPKVCDEDWSTVYQIVVPLEYRRHVMELAHEHLWSGHLGVTKTYNRILKHFFWPCMKGEIARYCKTCRTCQIVGKPNQVVPPAPLHPIPACGEPFEHVLVDCVGPLPRTKAGNEFMLTIMCVATRFPEAIPLKKITAPAVTRALTKFFTTFGLPKVVQTDQGTNFLSNLFKQTLRSLGISHAVSSAYHPESQGALKRWHQTLKSMLRKYCHETGRSWDEGVPFVLFAIRDAKQESLGFSPAELVFGHNVRGPLKVLTEKFMLESEKMNVLDFVSQCRERLHRASTLAKEALAASQSDMKRRFDRKAVVRQFNPGDKVLVLLPMPGAALRAQFSGPYVVKSQVSPTDYIILTPERRRKTRLCHVNMLKSFLSRDATEGKGEPAPATAAPGGGAVSLACASFLVDDDLEERSDGEQSGRLSNSSILANIEAHLSYLSVEQRSDVVNLLHSHPSLFGDVPSRTSRVLSHDIDVGSATPIKQHAYRCPLPKREVMKQEVEYLLENGLAKPSSSPWSSPCLLALKADGTPRFCTDFQKVNSVTVPDSFPLPRMEDCIDSIGPASIITKLDLLKGYWQVPLTARASAISAFVTPDHFLQYNVMAFGLRNAPATFQRLMHLVLGDVPACNVYLDDVVVYSDSWADHVSTLSEVFRRLATASLTLTLAQCEFAKATVTYLGKRVGHGQVRPVDAKVQAVVSYPVPSTRRELRQFLGMGSWGIVISLLWWPRLPNCAALRSLMRGVRSVKMRSKQPSLYSVVPLFWQPQIFLNHSSSRLMPVHQGQVPCYCRMAKVA
uniref:Gypsy retrotransposon integrase-like protein 1 n=1 Tax=Sparus aurata TaxID=8175 RepID=A0A671WFH3_SPAAU